MGLGALAAGMEEEAIAVRDGDAAGLRDGPAGEAGVAGPAGTDTSTDTTVEGPVAALTLPGLGRTDGATGDVDEVIGATVGRMLVLDAGEALVVRPEGTDTGADPAAEVPELVEGPVAALTLPGLGSTTGEVDGVTGAAVGKMLVLAADAEAEATGIFAAGCDAVAAGAETDTLEAGTDPAPVPLGPTVSVLVAAGAAPAPNAMGVGSAGRAVPAEAETVGRLLADVTLGRLAVPVAVTMTSAVGRPSAPIIIDAAGAPAWPVVPLAGLETALGEADVPDGRKVIESGLIVAEAEKVVVPVTAGVVAGVAGTVDRPLTESAGNGDAAVVPAN